MYRNEYTMSDTDIDELDPSTRQEIARSIADEREVLARALNILERNDEYATADKVRATIRSMDAGIWRLWCEHANWDSSVWDGVREYECRDCGRNISATEAGDTGENE